MTEDTGFPEPENEPEPLAEPEPAGDAEPAPEPAEDVTEPQVTPAESSTLNAPEPLPAPYLPEDGIQADVRAAILNLHNRLVALGG